MPGRIRKYLWLALLLSATACGGAQDSEAGATTTGAESDWGTGKTYDQCTQQGLTDYGIRTGQRWIGDFYADLYECSTPIAVAEPTTGEAIAPPSPDQPDETFPPAVTVPDGPLPPLQGLRFQPIFTDVRQVLGHDFAMPTQITARPGDELSYLITREGRVWVFEENTFSNPPVLDLRDTVKIGSETGLLGIALHPTDPHRMFLYHTDLEFDIIVAEYRLDQTLRKADDARTLLKIPTRSDFHKGGMIAFGPDGFLYIGVGDDGFHTNGQDSTSLFSAILRIDVDGDHPYEIPDDHPPVNPETPEVYFYGVRNPWRFWIDPETNLIYIGDVGADAFEEIDVTSLDQPGANFGWGVQEGHQWGPFRQGTECRDNPGTCDTSGFTLPALALAHGPEICAVVGGVVYRGEAIPELAGRYFYSDLCGGFLRSFRWDGSLATDLRDWTPESGTLKQLLSFGVDAAGEMYVLTGDAVYRIEPVR